MKLVESGGAGRSSTVAARSSARATNPVSPGPFASPGASRKTSGSQPGPATRDSGRRRPQSAAGAGPLRARGPPLGRALRRSERDGCDTARFRIGKGPQTRTPRSAVLASRSIRRAGPGRRTPSNLTPNDAATTGRADDRDLRSAPQPRPRLADRGRSRDDSPSTRPYRDAVFFTRGLRGLAPTVWAERAGLELRP